MQMSRLQHGQQDQQHYRKIPSNRKVNYIQGGLFWFGFGFSPLNVFRHRNVKISCFHQKLFSSWPHPRLPCSVWQRMFIYIFLLCFASKPCMSLQSWYRLILPRSYSGNRWSDIPTSLVQEVAGLQFSLGRNIDSSLNTSWRRERKLSRYLDT